MSKPMTAAEYAAHAESVQSGRPTQIVTLKSGAVFELRKPDIEALVILGIVPQSLLNMGMEAWEKNGVNMGKPVSRASQGRETLEKLELMREVVADACVQPPFNETTAKFMLKQDFIEIFEWATGNLGVAGLAGLQTFRPGSERGIVGDSVDSEKQRLPSERATEAEASVQ